MTFGNLVKRGYFIIGLCILLSGCSDGALAGAVSMDKAKVWLEQVNFKVSKKVNSNAPVSVHLIIIYDDGVLGQVAAMTADQYFTAEPQLRKDHANDIDITEWEIVPGQEVESEPITLRKAYGKGAFVFARYSTPDAHREAIADEQEITVHLDEKDFFITKNR
jgi:type VI secretion system protein